MATTLIDRTGQRFGRLLVLKRANAEFGDCGRPKWLCRCDCGVEKVVLGDDLNRRKGRGTVSCGCLQRENRAAQALACTGKLGNHFVHGGTGTPEYILWAGIVQRCTNPRYPKWKYWGGRGITVCQRWRYSFQAFLNDVGKRPSPELQIDRINNDGNYEPGNVRWATRSQQNKNRHTEHWKGRRHVMPSKRR